jgi:hypothetical protein
LPEGYNFITVRAFRHRADGGPAVFTDFKKVVYLDRLPPPAAVVSFDPYASDPSNPNNRDLIVRSIDGTANNMHYLFDLPANSPTGQVWTSSQILTMVSGSNQATRYDFDFVRGFSGVTSGNHVVTVVTYEPTGNYNIERFAGLFTDTNIGAGFGDLNASGRLTTSDIRCTSGSGACGNNSAEDVLYNQNKKFRAAFDINGDGLGDNRDLFALGGELVATPTALFGSTNPGTAADKQAVLDTYTDLLFHRGDLTGNGTTDLADMAELYTNFDTWSWLADLHVDSDNIVNALDVEDMVTQIFRTVAGDFNLDGRVDGADYVVWRKSGPIANGARYTQGDADLDGDVDNADLTQWRNQFGFVRQPLTAGAGSMALAAGVPEPATTWLVLIAGSLFLMTRRKLDCQRCVISKG